MSLLSLSQRYLAAAGALLLVTMTAGWQAQRCHAGAGPGDVIDLVALLPAASISIPPQNQEPRKSVATVHVDDGQLVLPFGSRVTYELELPPFAELRADRIRPRGTATARLAVSWQPDGGEERLLSADLEALAEPRVRIGNQRTEKGRLHLAATSRRIIEPTIASLIVVEPRVVVADPPSPGRTSAVGRPGEGAPNVIVFIIDALRADHVGCYGSARGATPNLDRFAAEAVVFTDAQAQAPLTNPAVASIFTGLWPQRHQVVGLEFKLRVEAETLAEVLTSAGIATAAIVANGNLDPGRGFAQGFAEFESIRDVRADDYHARAADINEALFDWLDRGPGRPFFLYVHTLGPHAPYRPREPFRSRFAGDVVDPTLGTNAWQQRIERSGQAVGPEVVAGVTALYDAEVAENDAAFGELVEELRRRGLLEETVVVVAADHGEELFDHGGFGHGSTLHAEVLDIPLMIRFPRGRSAGRVESVVEQVDLMPTVLAIFGLTPPSPIQGRSLLPLCGTRPPAGWKDRAVSHLRRGGRVSVSLLDPSWKLIVTENETGLPPALFDRRAEPGEQHDLAAEHGARVRRLRSKLQGILDHSPGGLEGRPTPVELDPEREEQLRVLGYL